MKHAVITAGMVITGDVSSEGSMDLVGTINGNIDILGKLNITGYINGNSKAAEIFAEGAKINGEIVSEGSVKIGASSVVIGNITATSAAIAGAVKGDIDVQGPVSAGFFRYRNGQHQVQVRTDQQRCGDRRYVLTVLCGSQPDFFLRRL